MKIRVPGHTVFNVNKEFEIFNEDDSGAKQTENVSNGKFLSTLYSMFWKNTFCYGLTINLI